MSKTVIVNYNMKIDEYYLNSLRDRVKGDIVRVVLKESSKTVPYKTTILVTLNLKSGMAQIRIEE